MKKVFFICLFVASFIASVPRSVLGVGHEITSKNTVSLSSINDRLVRLGYDLPMIRRLNTFFPDILKQMATQADADLIPYNLYRGLGAVTITDYDPKYFSAHQKAMGIEGSHAIYTANSIGYALIYASDVIPAGEHSYIGLILHFQLPRYIASPGSDDGGPIYKIRPELLPDERMFLKELGIVPDDIREGDKLDAAKVKWLEFDQVYDENLELRPGIR